MRPGSGSCTGSLHRPDEPFEDAAARELREETGIQAQDGGAVECRLHLRIMRNGATASRPA